MSSRIVELPAMLCPNGRPAIAALVQRDQGSTADAELFLGKNYAITGNPPDSYTSLQGIRLFAWHGVLKANYTDQTFCIDTIVGAEVMLDGPDTVLDEVTDFDGLAGAFYVFIDDEIMFMLQPNMRDVALYSLPLVRGQFGTPIQAHATGAEVYIIRKEALMPIVHSHFQAGNEAQFKLTLGPQGVGDVDSFSYDVTGKASQLPPPINLTVNGELYNAPYDSAQPINIAWDLPDAGALSSSAAQIATYLEFIRAGVVVHTETIPWGQTDLAINWSDITALSALNFTLRASTIVNNGWATVQGPTTTVNVYKFTSS